MSLHSRITSQLIALDAAAAGRLFVSIAGVPAKVDAFSITEDRTLAWFGEGAEIVPVELRRDDELWSEDEFERARR